MNPEMRAFAVDRLRAGVTVSRYDMPAQRNGAVDFLLVNGGIISLGGLISEMFDAFSEARGVPSMGVWLETGLFLDSPPGPRAINIIGLHLFVFKGSDQGGVALITRPLQECAANSSLNGELFVSSFYHPAEKVANEEEYLVREVLKEPSEAVKRALGGNGFRKHFLLVAGKEN